MEALILASAISMDAFVASFAYGSKQIKIPQASVWVINGICAGIFGASLVLGALVRPLLPELLTRLACFSILFLLGLVKLLDGIVKTLIRRAGRLRRDLNFSLFSIHCVLSLYADPEAADVDSSKTISPKEAASLALALSLDGVGVGFGAAVGNVEPWAAFFCALVVNAAAVTFGDWLGNRAAKRLRFHVSWLGGGILMLLAVWKLL